MKSQLLQRNGVHNILVCADLDAMVGVANSAKSRSLKDFDAATKIYDEYLSIDILIKHHLHILYEEVLEFNLMKMIEHFSHVLKFHMLHH